MLSNMTRQEKPNLKRPLRRGWTTGACATAATKAALTLLVRGESPDPVEITLPKGERPCFALAIEEHGKDQGVDWARVGIIKDAGDDPDVTHGALIVSTVRWGAPGNGIRFLAGPGVGTVTRAGLPVPPGQPAINPVPRKLMTEVIEEVSRNYGCGLDVTIEITVPGGEELAKKTWNPRLGIEGGLSILGTTGIVHPFSCSAWIHSIRSGIDVARAAGLKRVCGATGSTSEATAQTLLGLPDMAMLDMGDFVGGMLKYLRQNPVPIVVIAGGFAKMTKLSQGFMDLHSGRSQVDFQWLADRSRELGGDEALAQRILTANTAAEVLGLCQAAKLDIARVVGVGACQAALDVLRNTDMQVEVLVVGRAGEVLAHVT